LKFLRKNDTILSNRRDEGDCMARKAKAVECDEQSRLELERLSKSQSAEMRLVRRARMVLGCLDGKQIKDISAELDEQEDVIIKWRDRFLAKGIGGLHDTSRPGKPVTYDIGWKRRVLEKLDEKPPNNLARWDGPTLAAELETSEDAVQRFLKKEGIQLARMRTWCISTDPEFAAKAADIVGLYLNPPENAVVISVDEKPSIQALSRATGVVKTSNRKIVTAIKSTYKRNGTGLKRGRHFNEGSRQRIWSKGGRFCNAGGLRTAYAFVPVRKAAFRHGSEVSPYRPDCGMLPDL
jgi:transposase